MERNPYSPPTANVADVGTKNPLPGIDRHVALSCRLIWWSYAASILGMCAQLFILPDAASVVGALIGVAVGGAIGFVITRWIVSKLKAGRNWMRLFLTISYALGLLMIPALSGLYKPLFAQIAANPTYGVTTAIQWALGVTAIVYLNLKSARDWFATFGH